MGSLAQDLRFATRSLARRPGFAAVAVLTLALGIGANSAIISVADAVLLRDPPWAEPDRLALILGRRAAAGADRLPLSFPNFADFAERARSFDGIAAWNSSPGTTLPLTGRGEAEQVRYAAVSASLFDVLGVRPAIGRGFSTGDDVEGAAVVVVGHDFWVRRLGADPDAIGAPLRLDGRMYTVIGVLPADFRFIEWPAPPQVWLPLMADPSVPVGNRSPRWARGASYLGVVGRLSADASLASAQAEIDALARAIAAENPGMNRDLSFRVVALREQVVGGLRATLRLLLAAVALVLLIACANVANLLLARGAGRAREIAVRFALGASRRRVVAQLLAESLVLATAGGLLGVVFAAWAVDLLAANPFAAPDPFVPFAVDPARIGIDGRVLAFTLLLTVLTAALFGLAPALHGARRAPFDALREGGRASPSPAARRARDVLVIAEVALAVPLLTGAALLVTSLTRLQRVDAGFDPGSTVAAELDVRGGRYATPAHVAAFYDALLARVAAIPGVAAAGAVERLPLTGPQQSTDFRIEGEAPVEAGARPNVAYASVTPGALATLRVPLRAGRAFSGADDAQAARVALINEAAAARFFPGVDPVGRRIALTVEALRFGPDGPPAIDFDSAFREIVGVVADVRHEGLAVPPQPAFYVPFAQRPQGDMSVVVRAAAGTVGLAGALREAVRAVDRDQPVVAMTTLDDVVARALGAPRLRTHLLSTFALLAAALAAIGLYGVLAFAVSQRMHELGVRIAFGARPREIFGLVTARALRLAATGIVLGVIAAAALTRLLASLLFEVDPLDPLAFAAAPALLLAVALLASIGPARRATRVDPLVALRAE
jgi:putative ABC transport system permease protein